MFINIAKKPWKSIDHQNSAHEFHDFIPQTVQTKNFFTTLIRKLKLWKSPQKFYFMFHNLMPWIFNRHEIYSIAHLCGMLFSAFSSSILRLFLSSTQDLDPKRNGKRKKYFFNFVSLTTVEKFVVWSWFFVDLWVFGWSVWERVVDFCKKWFWNSASFGFWDYFSTDSLPTITYPYF